MKRRKSGIFEFAISRHLENRSRDFACLDDILTFLRKSKNRAGESDFLRKRGGTSSFGTIFGLQGLRVAFFRLRLSAGHIDQPKASIWQSCRGHAVPGATISRQKHALSDDFPFRHNCDTKSDIILFLVSLVMQMV